MRVRKPRRDEAAARKPSRFPPGFPLKGKPRSILRGLLDDPLASEEDLAAQVDAYLAALVARAEHEEFVDLALAQRLGRCARGILGALAPDAPEDVRRLAHAAVRYFLLETDAEGDLSSPIGFDDDRDVLNAVARTLGRDDLVVEGEAA